MEEKIKEEIKEGEDIKVKGKEAKIDKTGAGHNESGTGNMLDNKSAQPAYEESKQDMEVIVPESQDGN